jgi:hypothetical protein
MGLLPVSLLLDDPPCDEFQLPLSLSLGVFFCTSKSLLCPLHHLAMFAATLDYLLKVASWTTTNNMLSSEQILKGGCDQLVCDRS